MTLNIPDTVWNIASEDPPDKFSHFALASNFPDGVGKISQPT